MAVTPLTPRIDNLLSLNNNALINGAFDIWQRGSSITITNTNTAYQADRWYGKNSLGTNGVLTYSRTTGFLPGSKWGTSLQITTAPTAGQTNGCELYQTLENWNSFPFYNGYACFSIYIKSLNNVNQVGLQFFYATSEAKVTTPIGSEVLVSVNSSSFTLGQIVNQAISTLPTVNGVVGVRIRITGVTSGNTYDLNNGFIVEQAIMNVGSVPSIFHRAGRNIGDEISMCQRYYEKSFPIDTAPANGIVDYFATATVYTATSWWVAVPFKVPKRINTYVFTPYGNAGTGYWYIAVGGSGNGSANNVATLYQNTIYSFLAIQGGTGFSAGSAAIAGMHWTVDAEI
jgi:hypothetical protein